MNNPNTSTEIETDQNLSKGVFHFSGMYLSRFLKMKLRPIEINPEMLNKVLVWMEITSQWHWGRSGMGGGFSGLTTMPVCACAVLSTHRIAGELQGKNKLESWRDTKSVPRRASSWSRPLVTPMETSDSFMQQWRIRTNWVQGWVHSETQNLSPEDRVKCLKKWGHSGSPPHHGTGRSTSI